MVRSADPGALRVSPMFSILSEVSRASLPSIRRLKSREVGTSWLLLGRGLLPPRLMSSLSLGASAWLDCRDARIERRRDDEGGSMTHILHASPKLASPKKKHAKSAPRYTKRGNKTQVPRQRIKTLSTERRPGRMIRIKQRPARRREQEQENKPRYLRRGSSRPGTASAVSACPLAVAAVHDGPFRKERLDARAQD